VRAARSSYDQSRIRVEHHSGGLDGCDWIPSGDIHRHSLLFDTWVPAVCSDWVPSDAVSRPRLLRSCLEGRKSARLASQDATGTPRLRRLQELCRLPTVLAGPQVTSAPDRSRRATQGTAVLRRIDHARVDRCANMSAMTAHDATLGRYTIRAVDRVCDILDRLQRNPRV